jgi:hypothetical protein
LDEENATYGGSAQENSFVSIVQVAVAGKRRNTAVHLQKRV